MFNRLIAKTSLYKSLMALWEGEHTRAEFYRNELHEAEDDVKGLEEEVSGLKKKDRVLRRKLDMANNSLDEHEQALDMAIRDKYRAIGANVPLSDEIAHLRRCLEGTEYAHKYLAEQADQCEEICGTPGWAVKALAQSFAGTMGDAKNFVSSVISHPDHGDFEFMVRRRDGMTIGEWSKEATGHLEAMTKIVGVLITSNMKPGEFDAFSAAVDWLESTEKLTHDFVTRNNEVKASIA